MRYEWQALQVESGDSCQRDGSSFYRGKVPKKSKYRVEGRGIEVEINLANDWNQGLKCEGQMVGRM